LYKTMGDSCSRCKTPLGPGQARDVPRPLVWLTALSFGFMHGGLWVFEGLKGPFCGNCRNKLAAASALAACAILAVAGGLGLWWVTKARQVLR
jgi:hypothetical protein